MHADRAGRPRVGVSVPGPAETYEMIARMLGAVAALALGCAGAAEAAVVYDNGSPMDGGLEVTESRVADPFAKTGRNRPPTAIGDAGNHDGDVTMVKRGNLLRYPGKRAGSVELHLERSSRD